MEKLRRVNPSAFVRAPGLSQEKFEEQLFYFASALIVSDINEQREEWAKNFVYYGSDPGPRGDWLIASSGAMGFVDLEPEIECHAEWL